MKLLPYISMLPIFLFSLGCDLSKEDRYKLLSQQEKDYIERFNITVKDIRDFPPEGKNIEKYFYVFKSVANIEDAKIILFGEEHTNANNKLWTAGLINKLMTANDVALFEGDQAGTRVFHLSEHFTTKIFATREYEKVKAHKQYVPLAISKMKNKFFELFFKTKDFLVLDILNLGQGKGFYWDLVDGEELHSDCAKRNETMVQTIKDNLKGDARVFVIAGALHMPHYEFAQLIHDEKEISFGFDMFKNYPGTKEDEINDAFYNYFLTNRTSAKTRSIFEFLKDKDFAVLIPKNLPGVRMVSFHFPKNAR